MSKTRNRNPTERPRLTVPLEEAKLRLQEQMKRGRAVPNASINENEEARRWYEYTEELLRQICTTDELRDDFTGRSSYTFGRVDISTGAYLRKLQSIFERLELLPEAASVPGTKPAVRRHPPRTSSPPTRVFVVHGHDEGARESVARFLEKLGVEVVILHEKPSSGRTIIEKLESHSDVDFALVLLTPDDVGSVGSAGRSEPRPRARQNVILELGYFLGALGRSRVCALYRGAVELPSDIHGVIYVPLDDSGAWKLVVGRELRSAGFDVDLNLIT